jgi:hypothetical protein
MYKVYNIMYITCKVMYNVSIRKREAGTNRSAILTETCASQAEVESLYNSDFFPNNWTRGRALQRFCQDGVPTQGICSSVLFLLGGLNSTQLNTVSSFICGVT